MPLRIVIIAEAEADRRMICGLVDRKIVHHAPVGFDHDRAPAELERRRTWCGLEAGTAWTAWKHLARFRLPAYGKNIPGVRALRFARPEPGGGGFDQAALRGALASFLLGPVRADALIVSRDLDGRHAAERRASLEGVAREAEERGAPLLLAVQDPMREAWLLNGFIASHPAETARAAALRAELGFDPCARPDQLTAADETAKRNAKRVLRALTEDDPARAEACWERAEWNTLRSQGAGSGLAQFLDEVKTRLLPMVPNLPAR